MFNEKTTITEQFQKTVLNCMFNEKNLLLNNLSKKHSEL